MTGLLTTQARLLPALSFIIINGCPYSDHLGWFYVRFSYLQVNFDRLVDKVGIELDHIGENQNKNQPRGFNFFKLRAVLYRAGQIRLKLP